MLFPTPYRDECFVGHSILCLTVHRLIFNFIMKIEIIGMISTKMSYRL